jgi:hypothetical protein
MISVADVEYTIWSNGSFVRVQRTVVEPVVAIPHIALSLGPIVTRSGNAYVPSGRPDPTSAHVENSAWYGSTDKSAYRFQMLQKIRATSFATT